MSQAMDRPRRKRFSWESRCAIVALIEAGVSPPLAAASGGASRGTGYRLWRRYQAGCWPALRDRPSTPHRQPRRLSVELEQRILAARRQTSYGPVRLAGLCAQPPSTIGKVLPRHEMCGYRGPSGSRAACAATNGNGRANCCTLTPKSSAASGRPASGSTATISAATAAPAGKPLHVAIDDHSRWLYAEVLPGERAEHCAAFLRRADNAKTYRGNLWRDTCSELGIDRRYIRADRPHTNGKAERAIQTLLNEWAYSRAYASSQQRTRALTSYLRWHNQRRPHSSLGNRPPISRASHLCGHDKFLGPTGARLLETLLRCGQRGGSCFDRSLGRPQRCLGLGLTRFG
jgi:transposase InsO family protein